VPACVSCVRGLREDTFAGARKFPELDSISAYYYTVDMVIAHGGPEARATVSSHYRLKCAHSRECIDVCGCVQRADATGVFDKLTNVDAYTGVCVHTL
jgi:hypothetical protein